MQATQKQAAQYSQDTQNFTNEASREKYWRELTIEEKFERMRTLLHSLIAENRSIRDRNLELEESLWNHTHDTNGETVLKIKKADKYKLNIEKGWNIKTPNSESEDFYI